MEKNNTASENACPACKSTVRDEKEKRAMLNRLSRIEGQVRGIRSMVENDAYCVDILNQVSAAGSALNSFSKEMLSSHIRNCVVEDVQHGSEEKLEELVKVLQKLMR